MKFKSVAEIKIQNNYLRKHYKIKDNISGPRLLSQECMISSVFKNQLRRKRKKKKNNQCLKKPSWNIKKPKKKNHMIISIDRGGNIWQNSPYIPN